MGETPSSKLSEISHQRDQREVPDTYLENPGHQERIVDILDAQDAANTAKPYMDVAVRLYDLELKQAVMDGVEEELDAKKDGYGLTNLVLYAETKARQSLNLGREIKPDNEERMVIESAEGIADHIEALNKVDIDTFFDDVNDNTSKLSSLFEDLDADVSGATGDEKSRLLALTKQLQSRAQSIRRGDDKYANEYGVRDIYFNQALDQKSSYTRRIDGDTRTKLNEDIKRRAAETQMYDFLSSHYPIANEPSI